MLATLLSTSLAVDPNRVHLVDAYPRGNPHNFLFRGNNPVTDSKFDLDAPPPRSRSRAVSPLAERLAAAVTPLRGQR